MNKREGNIKGCGKVVLNGVPTLGNEEDEEDRLEGVKMREKRLKTQI
jgi:hypothetical protein